MTRLLENKLESLKKNILDIDRDKKIEAIYLFGSWALGEQGARSDIDICVVGNLSKEEKMKILLNVSEKFDISFFDELPLYIRFRVFGEGKELFVRNEKRLGILKLITLKKYRDFKPLIDKRVREMFKNV